MALGIWETDRLRTTPDSPPCRRTGLAFAGLVLLVAVGAWAGVGAATAPTGGPFPQAEPTANLSASPSPAAVGEPVTLDARDSTGGNATIESCAFDVDGDGDVEVQAEACVAEWSYGTIGEYQATVRVQTANGGIATAATLVTVVENRAPIPAIAVDPAEPHPGEAVTFAAAGSRDPDGRIVQTTWRLPDRTFQGETATVTFPEPGEYRVSLLVVDDGGRENETVRVVSVVANEPPAATVAVATAEPRAGEPIELDATGTLDQDGTVTQFRWDLDSDGTVDRVTQTGRTSIVADGPGSRTATVVAVDDDGASANDAVTFEIAPAATADETAGDPDTGSAVGPSPATGDGLLPALDVGLVPIAPDWLVVLAVAVAAVGAGAGWRRRETVRSRVDGLRDRITRGDFRRRAARTASGAVTKTTAKRLLRTVADGIDASGRGVGGAFERLGRAIRRWSSRVAEALRRLAS